MLVCVSENDHSGCKGPIYEAERHVFVTDVPEIERRLFAWIIGGLILIDLVGTASFLPDSISRLPDRRSSKGMRRS